MLQIKSRTLGKTLGKITGWAHRLHLKRNDVKMLSGVRYHKNDSAGLTISIGGEKQLLEVDNIVVCAGQVEEQQVFVALKNRGMRNGLHVIGRARQAAELDAHRAIHQGYNLARKL